MGELIECVLEALGELIGEAIIMEITKCLEKQEEENNENEEVNGKSYRNSNGNGNGNGKRHER